MGNAQWSQTDWQVHARATSSQTRSQIFTASGMNADLDPAKIPFREARDSDANPASTPIILASDVTGSMGVLAEQIIKRDLGIIMRELYDRRPVSDPAIMCMAVGDANCDTAPLQVTQFESSLVLAEQLKNFYLEGGGGGNGGESYALAWMFAGYKTKVDSIKKRRHKGYLFTIGDEAPHRVIRAADVKRFLGLNAEADIDVPTMLANVQGDWHIFHLIVNPVSDQPVLAAWRELLGERAIVVSDMTKLAEGIVACIQCVEGVDAATVQSGWNGDSALAVRDVVAQLVVKS